MTYRCASCDVNWFPYMTKDGACPACGGGTVRTNEPSSPQAKELHTSLKAQGASADLHARFDEFYASRERERDPLETLADLPTVDRDL
jgi:hypothetical protein